MVKKGDTVEDTEEGQEEETKVEKETEPKKRYEVGQIATQTENVIIDNEKNKHYNLHEMIVVLGNDINGMKRLLK